MSSFAWPSNATNTLAPGAATSANQVIGNNYLASIDGKTPALGQALDTGSVPVVLTAAQLASLTALPAGSATSANQVLEIAQLTAINSNTTGVATAANQTTGNTSLATIATNTTGVATAANQTTANSSLATIATNTTGVATAANQVTGNTSLGTIATNTTGVSTAANQVLQTTQLTTIANSSGSPTGGTAGTASNLVGAKYNTTLPTLTNGQQTSLQVDASGRLLTLGSGSVGTVIANAPIRNDYGTTPVTTAAYVQLVASTSNTINKIHVFDSSGQAMIFAIGAAASEVDSLYVPPGGDTYSLRIPAGSRISYKALTANATSGYVVMSFLQ